MANTLIRKNFTFDPIMYNRADEIAAAKGMTFLEYMKYLIVKDFDKQENWGEGLSMSIQRAIDSYRKGRYREIKPEEDILSVLDTEEE
jgi:hypothetical protein